ncbi:MAG: secretin N-terminal domain-containing protein, partial [Planctomyces sp.]
MQPVLKRYPAAVADPDQFLATVKLIAPDGQFRIDSGSGRLVVWATAADQQKVSDSLQQLLAEQPQGGLRSVVNYPLQHVEPTAILTILASLTPTARVSLNSAGRGVVVFGTANEQQSVRDLIEQLDSQAGNVLANRTLQVYPVPALQSTQAVSLLATTVPRAQVVADPTGERLLVMETPPPGVFSYSDSKDYSTTAAIDLLNGWLLTKGFTLVRRERMLMCLDLKSGLPEGAIPRISPTELATRGRFEFVTVLFPLENRLPETVVTEVQPLLGTYGKVKALPQTSQLMVSDTVANLRLIETVVGRIPASAAAASGPPELIVYPVTHANPEQAATVLKQIVSGTVVVDAKARQISVNAVPFEQAKARTILQQLETNQGPDMQPVLKRYPAAVADPDQFLATVKLIAPDGQFRIDS